MPPLSALKPTTSPLSSVTSASPRAQDVPLATSVALVLLRGYKLLLSPLFTGSCRFHPSCSDYMAQAIRVHGVGRGLWLGLVRLSRCRPLGGHGFDPVPHR